MIRYVHNGAHCRARSVGSQCLMQQAACGSLQVQAPRHWRPQRGVTACHQRLSSSQVMYWPQGLVINYGPCAVLNALVGQDSMMQAFKFVLWGLHARSEVRTQIKTAHSWCMEGIALRSPDMRECKQQTAVDAVADVAGPPGS